MSTPETNSGQPAASTSRPTPDEALRLLQEGNARYVAGVTGTQDYSARTTALVTWAVTALGVNVDPTVMTARPSACRIPHRNVFMAVHPPGPFAGATNLARREFRRVVGWQQRRARQC